MPAKKSGFTSAGIQWYRSEMALLLLKGLAPLDVYTEASKWHNMAVQSLRQKISVKAMKNEALAIAGTETLEDFFEKTSNATNQAA
jgi:hypothetical protein